MRHIIGALSADQKKQVLRLKKEASAILRHFRSNANRDEDLQKAGEPDSEFHRVAAELFSMLREKGKEFEKIIHQIPTQDIPKDFLDLYADIVANDTKYARRYEGAYLITPVAPAFIPPTQDQVADAAQQLRETKEMLIEYKAAQEYLQDKRGKMERGESPFVDPEAVLSLDYCYGQFVNRVDAIEKETKGKLYGDVPQATWDEYFLLLSAIANYRPLKASV